MTIEQGLFQDIAVNKLKPLVKWAGGKSALLPVLLPSVPGEFGRFCEPFAGGAALFWELARSNSILSDTNEELIHFYRVVRDHPDELYDEISFMEVNEDEYYRIRSLVPTRLDEISRSARFLYLNKTCYNGLYRVNKKGQFNTPYGKKRDVKIVSRRKLKQASSLLRHTELLTQDYATTLQLLRAGDFAYIDPPYMPVGRYSDFNRYTRKFFTYADHEVLSAEFRKASDRGVHLLMSNSFNEALLSLYDGFNIREIEASRQINCKASGRGKVKELLISNS